MSRLSLTRSGWVPGLYVILLDDIPIGCDGLFVPAKVILVGLAVDKIPHTTRDDGASVFAACHRRAAMLAAQKAIRAYAECKAVV